MKLVLMQSDKYMGVIGEKTGTYVNGIEICVGDKVKIGKGSNNNPCENIVGIFGNKYSVMGLGSTPLSKLNVLEITKSHEKLTINSAPYNGYFKVKEFME